MDDAHTITVVQKLLTESDKETRECSTAVASMMEATAVVRDTISPSISSSRKELQCFFRMIDAVEEKIIPALNEDLTALENLVSALEIQKARSQPQTIQDWAVSLLSASTDSNDGEGHGSTNDLPEVPLHEPAKLLYLINELKPALIASYSGSPSLNVPSEIVEDSI